MYTIALKGGGFLTMAEVEFKCPACSCDHNGKDWEHKLEKSKKTYCFINCKGCKRKLGVSLDYRGDVVVWEVKKKDEKQGH